MILLTLYLALLLAGLVCFAFHYIALYRIARQLHRQHPSQWQIIVESPRGHVGLLQLWLRLLSVLRSPALPAMQDQEINRWQTVWRLSLWLAWLCWIGALLLQWLSR